MIILPFISNHLNGSLLKFKYNRARKKVKGKKNSIRWINGKDMKTFSDIQGNDLTWFYNYGANLGITCYLLLCLIAHAYHVKQHMPFINFNSKDREKISFYISHLQEILNRHLGIYTLVQYDIGRIMFDDDSFNRLITYKQFCKLVLSDDAYEYCCFVQVFNFILNIANDERKHQCDDLINHLESFNAYLETLY